MCGLLIIFCYRSIFNVMICGINNIVIYIFLIICINILLPSRLSVCFTEIVSPSEIAYLVNDILHFPLKYGLLKYTRTPLEQKCGMKWQMDCLHVIHILSHYQSEATTIIYKCYKIRECTFLCTFSVLQFNSCVIIMFLAFHQAFFPWIW